MRRTLVLLAAAVGACSARPEPTAVRPRPIVAQLDHIMFVSGEHARVIALLTDTLRLPLVWPAPNNPTRTSSGISFGNVTLEIMHSMRDRPFLSSLAFQPARWPGMAEELAARGVPTLEPGRGPVDSTQVYRGPRWTILSTPGFGRGVFLIQYHHFDMNERRASFAAELNRRSGGRLGIVRMREVVAGVDSLGVRLPRWKQLFGEPSDGQATWLAGSGPRVTPVSRDDSRADMLIVEVRSIAAAQAALDSLRVSYTRQGSETRLDPARLGGLKLALVAAGEGNRPDFSGRWRLDSAASRTSGGGRGDAAGRASGGGGGAGGGTGLGVPATELQVEQTATLLSIQETRADSSTALVRYRFDGEPISSLMPIGRGRSSMATYTSKWDGPKLVSTIKRTIENRGGRTEIQYRETMSLAPDGALTVETVITGRTGGGRTAVYLRVP